MISLTKTAKGVLYRQVQVVTNAMTLTGVSIPKNAVSLVHSKKVVFQANIGN